MSDRLDRTLGEAVAAGILPAWAARRRAVERPWPVILFTALGAWLAAVPLLAAVHLLLGNVVDQGISPYLIGILVLAPAVIVLLYGAGAATGLGPDPVPGWGQVFVEQLAVPGLLTGCGSLAFGLYRDLPEPVAAAVLTVLALGLAVLLPRPWLRVLCGAAAAVLLALTLEGGRPRWLSDGTRTAAWLALHGVLLVWLLGLAAQWRLPERGSTAALAGALEAIGAGWLTATLAGLALWAGMTLLAGAGLHWDGVGMAPDTRWGADWMAAASALLALGGVAAGARAWGALRQPWVLAVGLVIVWLAWFMPTLGGIWLALTLMVLTHRFRLATTAALAAAWVIGAFYYQLHWTLATKALVLAGAGVALAALAWIGAGIGAGIGARPAWRLPSVPPTRTARHGLAPWLIALTGIAALAAVNSGIREKETLIATGRPVFVALAPVDPRSLMQGDYMRLDFRLPRDSAADPAPDPARLRGPRPRVVARTDARGVAELVRLAPPGEPLGEGEFLIELTPRAGRWTLVSDAWFFKEGEAARYASARYGEFRVAPDGGALLVGLADADLLPLGR